ncbi:MAG: NAD(P)-dependent oxidoreductase [Candidatus Paceibacterota bacterium]
MESNSKDSIFITGATGFIGANLARTLVTLHKDVHILVRPLSDTSRLTDIIPQITIHEGDLLDKDNLKKIIDSVKPRGVFHLAAKTVVLGVKSPEQEMISSNFEGTINILNVLENHDFDFFIESGTFIEYAPIPRPIKEDDLCEPKEIYGLTKLASTLYAKMIADTKGLPIIVFRFFTPFGPFLQKGKLVEQTITKAFKNEDIFLTKSSIARDFIYIDDLITLLLEASEKAKNLKGSIFNAGSGKKTTLKEFSDFVLKKTGSSSKIVWQENKASIYDSDFWQADMTKVFDNFSWRPKYSLEEGLEKTIEYFKKS